MVRMVHRGLRCPPEVESLCCARLTRSLSTAHCGSCSRPGHPPSFYLQGQLQRWHHAPWNRENHREWEGSYSRIWLSVLWAFIDSSVIKRWMETPRTWEMPHWVSPAVPAQNSGHWWVACGSHDLSLTVWSFWRASVLFRPTVNLWICEFKQKKGLFSYTFSLLVLLYGL